MLVAQQAGVHYALVNFAAARLRLEYDREQTSTAAISALARGLGVVDALRSGALVRPFEAVAADSRAYHFVRPAGSRDERLERFQQWLTAALADDVAALKSGIGLARPR